MTTPDGFTITKYANVAASRGRHTRAQRQPMAAEAPGFVFLRDVDEKDSRRPLVWFAHEAVPDGQALGPSLCQFGSLSSATEALEAGYLGRLVKAANDEPADSSAATS